MTLPKRPTGSQDPDELWNYILCLEMEVESLQQKEQSLDKEPVLSNGWVFTPEKEISYEHCGQPAYWDKFAHDEYSAEHWEVFCSKCQEMLVEEDTKDYE